MWRGLCGKVGDNSTVERELCVLGCPVKNRKYMHCKPMSIVQAHLFPTYYTIAVSWN
jgi:hypothetical protein